MDTLDRYLVREFLLFFLVSIVGMAVLLIGVDFLSHFWELKWPIAKILLLYAFKVPAALQQFVPVACLIATLLVLTNMSRQNEILALYSSGIGSLRIVSTFVAIVAAISTFSFLMFDSLVPLFSKKTMLLQRGLDPRQEEALWFNNSGFWYRAGNVLYRVERFLSEDNSLNDVRVYVMDANHHLSQLVRAKKAVYDGTDWVLKEGFTITYSNDNPFPTSASFEEMRGVIPDKPGDFKTLSVDEQTMRLKDLRHYISRNKNFGLDTTVQQVSYHERLALVFTPLVFVLLGIPFAMRPGKTQSFARSIGFCFLVIFFYLLSVRFVVSLGRGGHLPAFLAGWGPNILFLSVALIFIRKRI